MKKVYGYRCVCMFNDDSNMACHVSRHVHLVCCMQHDSYVFLLVLCVKPIFGSGRGRVGSWLLAKSPGSQNVSQRLNAISHCKWKSICEHNNQQFKAVASAITWAVAAAAPPVLHHQKLKLWGEVRMEGRHSSWDREVMGHWGAGGGRPPLSCGLAARCTSRRPAPPPWPLCLQERCTHGSTPHLHQRHTEDGGGAEGEGGVRSVWDATLSVQAISL